MFEDLDKLENLKFRSQGPPDGRRRRFVNGGCNDAVTDLLAECQSPSQLACLAVRFGLSQQEIAERACRAAGFGQFRMAIGNRIRGVVRRMDRARRRGRRLALHQAARPSRPQRTGKDG